MDTLTSTLDPEKKVPYHPSIVAAMAVAKKKLDRYYSLTDEAAPYRIAMGECVPFLARWVLTAHNKFSIQD
jgi:hypothetical protein